MQKIVLIISFFLLLFGNETSLKAQDSLQFDVTDTVIKLPHSPTRAAILSAVMPGMGQIYNKKYWKLVLVYGGLGTTGYFIVHYNNLYQQYLNAYIRYNKYKDDSLLDDLPKFNRQYDANKQLEFYKNSYHRYRDLNVLIFSGLYILNIIDATVDAYLFNYDISDDLSLRIEPTVINSFAYMSTPGIKLSFTIR